MLHRLLRGLALLFWSLFMLSLGAEMERGADNLAALRSVGDFWYAINPESLGIAQAAIQRYIAAWLWDPAIVRILLAPAVLLTGGLAVLFAMLAGWRRRYR